MRRMQARDRLEGYEVVTYPHRKNKDQRKRHRKATEAAYPDNFISRPLKTSEIELV